MTPEKLKQLISAYDAAELALRPASRLDDKIRELHELSGNINTGKVQIQFIEIRLTSTTGLTTYLQESVQKHPTDFQTSFIPDLTEMLGSYLERMKKEYREMP